MSENKEVSKDPKKNNSGGLSAPVASKKTSVDLTGRAEVVKEKFQPIYGLKNTLSGGLMLFELAKADRRVAVIRFANGEITRDEFYGTLIGSPENVVKALGLTAEALKDANAAKRGAVEKVLCAAIKSMVGPSRQ